MSTESTTPTPAPAPASERYLTVAEAAEFAGLSEKTVREHIYNGRLRAHQVGGRNGRIRIPLAAAYEWLNRYPVRGTERLEDIDWETPREGSDPDELTICDEYTNYLRVAQSRLGEFFAKKQELGQ